VRSELDCRPEDYQKFQERVFAKLDALEKRDYGRTMEDFVELGKSVGIDVISEILDSDRNANDLMEQIEVLIAARSSEHGQ